MRKSKQQPTPQAKFNVNDLTDYDIDVLIQRIGRRMATKTMVPTVFTTTYPTSSGNITVQPPINTWSINGNQGPAT